MIHAHKKRKVMRRAYACHGVKYTKICEQTANLLTCFFYLSNLELAMRRDLIKTGRSVKCSMRIGMRICLLS